MPKKSVLTEVVDAVKSVAGAALGAAASAGTEVVVESAATAMSKGHQKLGAATPGIKRAVADTVSKPILPKKQNRAAAKRTAKKAKKKVAARKGAKKRAPARKKR
jgi:hypothetical protein